MELTKHNICSHIDDTLKSLNVRYTVLHSDSLECLYEIYVSSIVANIQVEYNLENNDDNYLVVQFFLNDTSLYHSEWDNESPNDSIEDEIEELINATKRINQGISKIRTKIEQIKDICEEYNLKLNRFLDLIYDFDS